jgi:hypothetical protein
MVGCREAPPPARNVSDRSDRGPFALVVEATPAEIWIGDTLTLTLRVHTPADGLVEFPDLGRLADHLKCTPGPAADARPAADGGLDWQQSVAIEPLVSGEIELPPLAVRYGRRAAAPDEAPSLDSELPTGALKVQVRSALTTQDSVGAPRDITGTLLPPWRLSAAAWAALVGAVLIAVCGGYLLYRWARRRLSRAPSAVLPEVWALRALAELAQGDWLETGRARQYYYRMTEVVRTYIERKFGLAAPEMTTDEFLHWLRGDLSGAGRLRPSGRRRAGIGPPPIPLAASAPAAHVVLADQADRLRDFLEACDLVKYAALHPRREDAEQALSIARAFIDATAAAAAVHAARELQPVERSRERAA